MRSSRPERGSWLRAKAPNWESCWSTLNQNNQIINWNQCLNCLSFVCLVLKWFCDVELMVFRMTLVTFKLKTLISLDFHLHLRLPTLLLTSLCFTLSETRNTRSTSFESRFGFWFVTIYNKALTIRTKFSENVFSFTERQPDNDEVQRWRWASVQARRWGKRWWRRGEGWPWERSWQWAWAAPPLGT